MQNAEALYVDDKIAIFFFVAIYEVNEGLRAIDPLLVTEALDQKLDVFFLRLRHVLVVSGFEQPLFELGLGSNFGWDVFYDCVELSFHQIFVAIISL